VHLTTSSEARLIDEWNWVRVSLLALPIEVAPADHRLAELAGEIKATKKMSLADCFAAALAKQLKAELYTGDPEFREVEKDVKIRLAHSLRDLRLAEPEPKILGAGSLAHFPLETTQLTQALGIVFIEGDAHPGIRGASMAVPNNAVHLEFKKRTRPEDAAYFPAIRGDHLGARNVLEDDE